MSIVKRLLSSPVITVTLAGSLGLMMWEVHQLRTSHVGITHSAPIWSGDRVAQVETIFTALNMKELDVPVDRAGSGGALTSLGNDLIVMTHEGGFFEVSGDEAVTLDIAPPPNGWEAMLDFEEANPDYNFAHFYFRYNDVDVVDGKLIVSFTEWVEADNCYRTTLSTAPLNGTSVDAVSISSDDWTILYATDPCLAPNPDGRAIQGHMAGGRFRVDDDGTLYLAAGDYAMDGTYSPVALSQDPDQMYGKVLAVDTATGEHRVLSQGHSNMQGIAFDADGRLWTVEHGRRGGDELNLIREGSDYGWPQVSLGTRYNKLPLPDTLDYGRHPEFQLPAYSWLPSVAVSSLAPVDDFHPAWDGDMLAGSLAGNSLFRIRTNGEGILFAERIPLGFRIRYVHQHGDTIALWTDQKKVLHLTVGEFDPSYQFAVAKIGDLGLSNRTAGAVETALDGCAECHGFGVLPSASAPSLGEVYGRKIAGLTDFDYSQSLSSVGGEWTREQLVAFLDNPQSVAQDTSMPDPALDDPEVINALVDILISLREQAE
ncbi:MULTISPECIES: PQQ-dependent sugar dehydrogenase [unclassified Ruegeria]|uniref:PQQ-dependent sugar dehydrogenase n=1 Tax=unclassified Ruegeria TaxID=2625375 RepID=UPI001488C9EE|nr:MULTISPECIES: PQQ-dependent sugar dehydrogenase [unclassified Ruegeria]